MNGQRGFTLLEALTTLVVAAIIIGVGIPAMTSLLAKRRIEAAATELQAQLQLVRSQAIKQNHDAFVSFAQASDGWRYGLDDKQACDPMQADDCTVHGVPKVFTSDAWKGVTMSQDFTASTVGFEPRRGMTIHPGNVTLSSSVGKVQVRVNPLGQVLVCTLDGSMITRFPACG